MRLDQAKSMLTSSHTHFEKEDDLESNDQTPVIMNKHKPPPPNSASPAADAAGASFGVDDLSTHQKLLYDYYFS